MAEHLHHVHLFTEDIDRTIAWWRDMLDGQVMFDRKGRRINVVPAE